MTEIANAESAVALLDAALDAAGGLERWREHSFLSAHLSAGVVPAICDLEQATVDQIAAAVSRSDAVVFAAGAGPGSGATRKLTMDRDGAIKLLNPTAHARGITFSVSTVVMRGAAMGERNGD